MAFHPVRTLTLPLRSGARLATVFLVMVCASLVVSEGKNIYTGYQGTLSEANTATVNMARALADHAEGSIDVVDTILVGVVERVDHGALREDPQRLHLFLKDMVARTPSLRGLFIYDAEGHWSTNSLEDITQARDIPDREYFLRHRSSPIMAAQIGNPMRSRSSGAWVIPVSRRLNYPDGRFAGVVLATMRAEYFRSYYESFSVGPHGTIMLASDAGRFYIRRPYVEQDLGADQSQNPLAGMLQSLQRHGSGSATLTSAVDPVERLYSYRHLRNFPLVVVVGLSKDESLARWRSSTYSGAAATGLLVVVLALLGWRIVRQLAARERQQRKLREVKNMLEATNASLQHLALSDGLTGLANRRAFDQRLAAAFEAARRDQATIALVMIDVDHFKRFNDCHGHVAGDQCLQAVAAAVRSGERRPGDLAARFGGEEFAILLPGASLERALAVADAVRAAILRLQLHHGASPLGVVSVSAGVAVMVPAKGERAGALVEAADAGLYKAKESGRNRACVQELVDHDTFGRTALGG